MGGVVHLHAEADEKRKVKKMMMMMMMMLLGCVLAAKKKERVPRWVQATLTNGSPKGAVDWLKVGTLIEPQTVHAATAKTFRDDGFHIPDFVDDGAEVAILLARNDPDRRPLLIYQPTAVRKVFAWVLKITTEDDLTHPQIDTLHTDERFTLKFTRGKGKFAPYQMNVQPVEDA